ncbi:MAG: class I SAM-dependent methyltransferase [Bryobacteraceae bacterium]|jgi:ubiquinone/menaquinone biosynthesis C-methylase UbiE
MTQEELQQQWYARYYRALGSDRNDPRINAGARFQALAFEFSLIRALAHIDIDPARSTLLDVGCGSAAGLYQYIRLGFKQSNVTGLDVQASRIESARAACPHARFVHGDASNMEFEDSVFDVVSESTLFVSLISDELRTAIASEMLRVCRPGGYLVLTDWRTPRPGNPNYKALTRREVRRLFRVGDETELVARSCGALIPPLGRFVSRHAWPFYFLIAGMAPALVGQVVYLLQKPPAGSGNWR